MIKNKKILLLLLLILGIGFATVTTYIYVNGTIKINKNTGDYDVVFTDVVLDGNNITRTALSTDRKTITYTTDEMKKIGDTSVLNFKVKNNSRMYDANVSIVCNNGEHSQYYTIASEIDGESTKLIEAKQVKNGTITIQLVRSANDAIDEEFTCTLAATSVERTSIVEEDSLITAAYTYNQATGTDTYCVDGTQTTCVSTECYKDKTPGACPTGTIIKYRVNDEKTETFHVMFDEGNYMTMQSQQNVLYNTVWVNKTDYISTYGSESGWGSVTAGPLTALSALKNATSDWNNVRYQTYEMGVTEFRNNPYTKCSFTECTENSYTLPQQGGNARIITFQELKELGCIGCNGGNRACPVWVNNYLESSRNFGGTVNKTDGGNNYGYWTMNTYSSYSVIYIDQMGCFKSESYNNEKFGIRAVIEINK